MSGAEGRPVSNAGREASSERGVIVAKAQEVYRQLGTKKNSMGEITGRYLADDVAAALGAAFKEEGLDISVLAEKDFPKQADIEYVKQKLLEAINHPKEMQATSAEAKDAIAKLIELAR